MIICTPYMSNYYLCVFKKIIDNKKIEKSDKVDNDMYIIHVNRYVIRTYSGLER
jgi:hypothetical protein